MTEEEQRADLVAERLVECKTQQWARDRPGGVKVALKPEYRIAADAPSVWVTNIGNTG